jgi:hypothetical protein
MDKTFFAAIGAALLLPAAAPAQNAPRPDPFDAKAATAPLVHRSAFANYTPIAAVSPAVGWRDANDAVLRIGGWRAHAREAAAPAASAPAAAASGAAATTNEPTSSPPAPPSGQRH